MMAIKSASTTAYWSSGPSCAGCDWWRYLNVKVGECRRSPPIPGRDRAAMLRMESVSFAVPAGHALTYYDHCCGEFTDTFDWTTLPLAYRARIGCKSELTNAR